MITNAHNWRATPAVRMASLPLSHWADSWNTEWTQADTRLHILPSLSFSEISINRPWLNWKKWPQNKSEDLSKAGSILNCLPLLPLWSRPVAVTHVSLRGSAADLLESYGASKKVEDRAAIKKKSDTIRLTVPPRLCDAMWFNVLLLSTCVTFAPPLGVRGVPQMSGTLAVVLGHEGAVWVPDEQHGRVEHLNLLLAALVRLHADAAAALPVVLLPLEAFKQGRSRRSVAGRRHFNVPTLGRGRPSYLCCTACRRNRSCQCSSRSRARSGGVPRCCPHLGSWTEPPGSWTSEAETFSLCTWSLQHMRFTQTRIRLEEKQRRCCAHFPLVLVVG